MPGNEGYWELKEPVYYSPGLGNAREAFRRLMGWNAMLWVDGYCGKELLGGKLLTFASFQIVNAAAGYLGGVIIFTSALF